MSYREIMLRRLGATVLLGIAFVMAVLIWALVMPAQPAQAGKPQQVPLLRLDPGRYPTDGTPEPSPSPTPSPSPQSQPNPIQQVIRYFFQIFFPANTFREAVEGAARAIFNAEVEALAEPMREVLNTVMFAGESVSGNVPLPGQFSAVADIMTKVAVPIWGLSLALMALAVLTRQAVGLGYGSNEVAAEAAKWFFIALASGNGYTLVTLVHNGIGALTRAIASGGGLDAGRIISALLFDGFAPDISIIILILIAIIGIITIIVLAVTYVARYALMVGLAALGPLAIACEGIPFTRFVFRDWLSMFLKVEMLQVLNVVVLRIFADLGLSSWGMFVEGTGGYLIKLVVMVGLASAIIGLNTSIFKQVFATAIEVGEQMKRAAEQLVGALMAVAGVAVTAGTGAALPAMGGMSILGAGGSSASSGVSGQNVPTSGVDASSANAFGTNSGSHPSTPAASGDVASVSGGKTPSSSGSSPESANLAGRRAAYRIGNVNDSASSQAGGVHSESPTDQGVVESAEGSSTATVERPSSPTAQQDGEPQPTSNAEDHTEHKASLQQAVADSDSQYSTARASAGIHRKSEAGTSSNGRDNTTPAPDYAAIGKAQHVTASDVEAVQNSQTETAAGAQLDDQNATASSTQANEAVSQLGPEQPAGVNTPADSHRTLSEAGAYARAISRGSGMGGLAGAALRGFGEGTFAGGQIFHQRATIETGDMSSAGYLDRLNHQQARAAEMRAERLAHHLGADSTSDLQQIAQSMLSTDASGFTPSGYTPDEMRQAHMANEPLLHDMVAQYGSPARAAAVGGYGSFSEMANAMAVERLQSMGVEPQRPPAPEYASFSPPVSTWAASQPDEMDEPRVMPHDFGMGAFVAGNLGSAPASAPEWARTMYSLRQAYPSEPPSVLTEFVERVQTGELANEAAARTWLERAVQERRPIAHDVRLWWKAEEWRDGGAAGSGNSRKAKPSGK